MSHEIEVTADGTAAFWSARVPAWHRLGTVTPDALTAAEALEVSHLGGWNVRKSPLQTVVITDDGVTTVDVPGKFATVRTNPFTHQPEALGVVGSVYTVIQNEDSFDFLTRLVGDSGMRFETAGSIYGGRQTFVTMKAPDTMLIGGVDPVDLYLLVANSHDGSTNLLAAATPLRVVCKNTLTAGLGMAKQTWTLRHSTNLEGKIAQAREAMAMTFRFADAFRFEADEMLKTKLTPKALDVVISRIWTKPAEDAPKRTQETWENRRAAILDLFTASPTNDVGRGTNWGGYNAITEWVD